MSIIIRSYFFLAICITINAQTEQSRTAIAILMPRNSDTTPTNIVGGSVVFAETENGLRITGNLVGLPAGKYGFHVHESGDISTCNNARGHFNPEGSNHGGRLHKVRHVGDLGNVEFKFSVDVVAPFANIDITDNILTLRGPNSVLGRTIILHGGEDDLGKGDHPDSLITGNAGPRVACGVIGMLFPISTWNSAVTSSPSFLLLIAAAIFANFRI